MNDVIHASDSTVVLTYDKISMDQLCYLSLLPIFKAHASLSKRSSFNQFQNNAGGRLGIPFPELILIQIKKRIISIHAN
jgi:hypothetical protein